MCGVDPVAEPDPFPDRPGWVSEGLKGRPDLALTPDTTPHTALFWGSVVLKLRSAHVGFVIP